MSREPLAPLPTAGRGAHATVVALLIASVGAGIAANAFLPLLLRESPVLLLTLQSSYPQMALASPRLDPEVFIPLVVLRRWVGELIAYGAGRVFGADALAWFARRRQRDLRLPTNESPRWRGTRDLVVLAVSHPVVSASAGVLGMSWLRFAALRIVGGFGWVLGAWYLAGELAVPLGWLATAIEANAVTLTSLAIIATIGGLWWRRTRERERETSGTASDGK